MATATATNLPIGCPDHFDSAKWEPQCPVCDGTGELRWWTCSGCGRDFDGTVEAPQKVTQHKPWVEGSETTFECAACCRETALRNLSCAEVAEILGRVYGDLERALITDPMDLAMRIGVARGRIAFLRDEFEERAAIEAGKS